MKIDLTCPSELWRCTMPREDYPACELMMYNLADRTVVSMEVTLILLDKAGEELERVIYRAHDLDGRPATAFAVPVPVEAKNAASAECVVEKIWFSDNSVWRRSKSPMTEYEPNALPNGRSLEQLRFVAGPDAAGFPSEQEGLWLCVCGRPNPEYASACVRCGRDKKQIFSRFTKEAVEAAARQREEQLALKAKAAREGASRLQLEREKVYEAKKARRRKVIRTIVTVLVLLATAYGTVFHLLPYVKYRTALHAMNEGEYAKAQAAFTEMGDYMDSESNVTRCLYLAAKEDLASGDAETLLSAKETLLSLGDYEDAADLAAEADYLRAGLLLDKGDIAGAAALYIDLGDYKDSPQQVTYCAYLDACALLDKGDYNAAGASFEELGDYRDSADKAKDCVYLPAVAAMEAGDAESAIAQLLIIPGYRDADAQLQAAYYLRGTQLHDAGELVAAGDMFLAAGDYMDAPLLASACIYAPAETAYDSKDYHTAAQLYARIPEYEDATDKYRECAWILAQNAIKDKEYKLALELLSTLPDSYEDVLEKRLDCIYLPALAALEKKDWQAAVDGLLAVPLYKDSEEKLQAARYGLAGKLTKDGDFAGAIAQYELLGDYKDSERQLRTVRYSRADQLMKEEKWEEAAALYTLLSDYRTSEEKLQEALLQQAKAAFKAEDYEAARALFASLEDQKEAQEHIEACDYAIAGLKADAGSTLEAAALYESLGKYQDAADKARALYYTLGTQAIENGQTVAAARYFAKAGDHQDAKTLAAANFDAYYMDAAASVQDAMDNGEYALAVTLLSHMERTDLPEKYAFLAQTWLDANYQEATRLFNAGQPYAARPYYEAIPGYKDADSRLEHTCYLILGEWQTADGRYFVFRDDGTCEMDGEEKHFLAEKWSLNTGDSADRLSQTHSISSVTAEEMTLRDTRNGMNRTIRLTRILPDAPDSDPAAEEAPAEQTGDFVVVDE